MRRAGSVLAGELPEGTPHAIPFIVAQKSHLFRILRAVYAEKQAVTVFGTFGDDTAGRLMFRLFLSRRASEEWAERRRAYLAGGASPSLR